MQTISAKVSDEFFSFCSKLAKTKNISTSELIKQAITRAQISSDDKERRDEHLLRLYHLNKIGNNLNQIAKYCNTKKVLDKQVLLALLDIQKSLKK